MRFSILLVVAWVVAPLDSDADGKIGALVHEPGGPPIQSPSHRGSPSHRSTPRMANASTRLAVAITAP